MTPPLPAYHPNYARLTAYLAARDEQRITLTFADLEQMILLAPLPYGARGQVGWWSNAPNRRRPWNHAWLEAGWRVTSADRLSGVVTFERFNPAFQVSGLQAPTEPGSESGRV
jgi:hypothetical protein